MRTFLFIYEPLTSKMLVTIELLTYPLNDPGTTTSLVCHWKSILAICQIMILLSRSKNLPIILALPQSVMVFYHLFMVGHDPGR